MKPILDYYTQEITKKTGITIDEIRSKSSNHKIVQARYALIYLLRVKADLRLKVICQHVNKDHSIIYHAKNSINDDFFVKGKIYNWIEDIPKYEDNNLEYNDKMNILECIDMFGFIYKIDKVIIDAIKKKHKEELLMSYKETSDNFELYYNKTFNL